MTNNSRPRTLKTFFKKITKKTSIIKHQGSITVVSKHGDSEGLKRTTKTAQKIKPSTIPTQKHILKYRMNNDFEICEMLGGQKKVAFANKEFAQRALDSNKTHTECDEKVNIVYYFDASQRLCLIYRHRKVSSWRQYERPASHSEGWSKNVRIIISIT